MSPLRLALCALGLLFATGGCLRNRIDRCAEIPPHPECANLDGGRDAPPPADAPADAGPSGDAAGDTMGDAP